MRSGARRPWSSTGTLYYSTTSTVGVDYIVPEFRSVLLVASFRIMMHDPIPRMRIAIIDLPIHHEQSAPASL